MSDNMLSVVPDLLPAANWITQPVFRAIATSLALSRSPSMHLISRLVTTAPDAALFDAIYLSEQSRGFPKHLLVIAICTILSIKQFSGSEMPVRLIEMIVTYIFWFGNT